MKKILMSFAVFAIAGAAWVGVNAVSANDSSLLSQNIEALAGGEGYSPTGNTGPGQIYDCPGPFTGDGKMCLCTNSYACSEVRC